MIMRLSLENLKKCEWLNDTLKSETKDDTIIETLDIDYENVESLKNLDDINTMRCGKRKELRITKIFN